jgi:hypothetical protein
VEPQRTTKKVTVSLPLSTAGKFHSNNTSQEMTRRSLESLSLNESREEVLGTEEEEYDEEGSKHKQHSSKKPLTKPKVPQSLLKPTRSSGRREEENIEETLRQSSSSLRRIGSSHSVDQHQEGKKIKRSSSSPR